MAFTEEFLHFLWKFRLFRQQQLLTSAGEPLELLSVGIHNKNAGPDFEDARIRIGNTLWAGNVEIHLRSGDWERHNHHQDAAYDNVILHVVYEADKKILDRNGTEIPQLVLKPLILPEAINRYELLMGELNWIPCEGVINHVEEIHIRSWLSRILIERLEAKSRAFTDLLSEYNGSWDDAFYIRLARNFGFKTNALPFELLARSLPQQVLARYKHQPVMIEALIFGQAGFLNEKFSDEYPARLQKEYKYLQKKYGLNPVDRFIWKYLRLRPQNFPSVRLAQFTALVIKSSYMFSRMLEVEDVKQMRLLFEGLKLNPYWKDHYRFDQAAGPAPKQLGDEAINNILINTVAVSLFAYGHYLKQDIYKERALALLENVPAETNHILSRFASMGIKAENGAASQALMHLKSCYCDAKKCLHCGIGIRLLKR